ncbi:MAG TPA: hypothetical protein VIQ31_00290 [Phormidium sp.]
MPKKANLVNHLDVSELKQNYLTSQDTVEAFKVARAMESRLGMDDKK